MKRVVVIGGGFAGTCIAQKLQDYFLVTLIDSKSYFEYTPGILRTIIKPEHWKKIIVNHKDYLPNVRLFAGTVSKIDKNKVYAGKEIFPFDYLAICSGSIYSLPIKEQDVVLPTRARHLVEAHKSLEKANNVLIIGGGLVGVELAAEIVTHYPDKKVQVIHAHKYLIERNNIKSRIYAANFLRKRGVEIIYEDRVINNNRKTFMTEKGLKLNADIAFLCTGITPNFSFLKPNFSYALNRLNQIRVNKHLQVLDFSHIFAAGDITNVAIEKTAQNAEKQAYVVSANILSLAKRRPLIFYKPARTAQVISLGKHEGIFESGRFTITGFIPALLKMIIEKREIWRRNGLLT